MARLGARVAIVSLQRLGDVLTSARLTDALSRRSSIGSVEVVHWDNTKQAAALLPGVDRTHALPFGDLKRRGRVHPLAAFASLRAHLETIRGSGFDQVFNVTSTRFASLVTPLLVKHRSHIRGPHIDDFGAYVTGHPAIEYLNVWGTQQQLNVFSHADVYAVAAGVRITGYPGLPDDTVAAQAVDTAIRLPRDSGMGPLAVHIRASESSKQWRDEMDLGGWRGLLAELRRRYRRPLFLLGSPDEEPTLRQLAETTGAVVAAWPLRQTAALLRRCAGLISVDTVAIHLAAQVGCPTIVLRQGRAGGLAFVPAKGALLVDSNPTRASVADVSALCGRHLFGHELSSYVATDITQRLDVREAFVDDDGFLGARCPTWLPATEQARVRDRSEQSWRELWRDSWWGRTPKAAVVATACACESETNRKRTALARTTAAPIGRWFQAQAPGRIAA